ncbi:MAG: twin-arginine translocation signal domain-containing protein, partial [Deltaproteobacteria bacterium]|nr:twin-arginine translocation signal domain-containing protein [Deltaproteobacteria bacterium]
MKDKVVTRRDFLRGTAGAALAAALGPGIAPEGNAQESTARVVLIRDADVLTQEGEIRGEVLSSMLDEALQALMGEKASLGAWQKLFKRTDVVGVKSNVWWNLPTPRELENEMKRRLLEVGIPEKNISVDDRGVLTNPVFQKATALINARPVRTHFW